jgi:hypothetical protein
MNTSKTSIGSISKKGQLAVDGKAMTRRTALTIPRGVPIDVWRNLGRQIFVIADSSGWWLGDWLIYGQANFPDRYKRAVAETSLDYQTLRNYAWVARQITPDRRRERLSFQHHAEVASLETDQQDLWLTRAEQFTWSRNELRRQIRASKNGDQEVEPVVNIQMNVIPDRRQLWQQAAEVAQQDLLGWIVNALDHAATRQIESLADAN